MYIHMSALKQSLMSVPIARLFSRSLVLILAAFVIHIGVATAADSPGDIQQQMKELLVGTITAHRAPRSGPRDRRVTTRTADTQEFVKQHLLGTHHQSDLTRRTINAPSAECSTSVGKSMAACVPTGQGPT